VVARAFAWSSSTAVITALGTALFALLWLIFIWLLGISWWPLLAAPAVAYLITLGTTWATARFGNHGAGATWWFLENDRGRCAVLTRPGDGQTRAYCLAALPRRRRLGPDLMRHVAQSVPPPLRGKAWPGPARTYVRWGAIDHGKKWWGMHEIEFEPLSIQDDLHTGHRRTDLLSGPREGVSPHRGQCTEDPPSSFTAARRGAVDPVLEYVGLRLDLRRFRCGAAWGRP